MAPVLYVEELRLLREKNRLDDETVGTARPSLQVDFSHAYRGTEASRCIEILSLLCKILHRASLREVDFFVTKDKLSSYKLQRTSFVTKESDFS